MARKKLLTEGEVRQFMKLASLGGLTETYLSNNPLEERDEDEELEDELHATEDELGAEDHLALRQTRNSEYGAPAVVRVHFHLRCTGHGHGACRGCGSTHRGRSRSSRE